MYSDVCRGELSFCAVFSTINRAISYGRRCEDRLAGLLYVSKQTLSTLVEQNNPFVYEISLKILLFVHDNALSDAFRYTKH